MSNTYWAVAQISGKRAASTQGEVSRSGFGSIVPLMRSKRLIDGQLSDTTRPAMPGYLFIWGASANFYAQDGRTIIARMLGHISNDEMQRIRDDNAAGKHDLIGAGEIRKRYSRRRRRPRPGKKMRTALAREKAA